MSIFDRYIVNQEIKSLLKVYPDFIRLYKFAKPKYVKRYDYNERPRYQGEERKKSSTPIDPEEYERMSLGRAKTKIVDLALSNPFDIFVTFTFKSDRQNVDAKKRQITTWFNNQRNLHGSFGYLMVPEYHKDGVSIHVHGLLMGYKGNLKDSGKRHNGRIVYNITSFQSGFTTAVKIDDIAKVAGYISKYITKDMPKFKGKQRYWRSNGLKIPRKILNPLLTAEDLDMFSPIHKGKKIEILEVRGQLSESDLTRIAGNREERYDDLYVAE